MKKVGDTRAPLARAPSRSCCTVACAARQACASCPRGGRPSSAATAARSASRSRGPRRISASCARQYSPVVSAAYSASSAAGFAISLPLIGRWRNT
jgi:hypothetical protein